MNKLIAISLLIIALSVGYYFVMYLPQKDQSVQTAKTQQATMQRACLADAGTNYMATWAADCKANAQRITTGYQNCVNTGLGSAECLSIWNTPDSSASCSLPATTADSLNNSLQNDKEDCYKQYP